MLHAEPSREHTTIRAAKDDTGLVLHLILRANELNQFNIIHHYLLHSQVDVVLRSEGFRGVIWVANAEVAMLTEHDQAFCLLGNCLGHESRIVIEAVDVAFITGIEENRAGLRIPVGIIDKVPHLEGLRLSFGIKVVQFGLKH